jgi:hypothetical protein
MEEGVGRGRGRGGGSLGAAAGYSLFGSGCDNGTAVVGTGVDYSGLGHNQTMLEGVPLLGI